MTAPGPEQPELSPALSRARRGAVAVFDNARTWQKWLALVAVVLAVFIVALAWLATTRWIADSAGDAAVWTWAIVAGGTSLVAAGLLLITATGKVHPGLSLAFVILAVVALVINLVIALAASLWWTALLPVALVVSWLGGLAFTLGIGWPCVEWLRGRMDAKAARTQAQ